MKGNFIGILALSLCVLTAGNFVHAQSYLRSENKVWAFGLRAGIDFTSGSAVAIRTPMKTREASVAVYDKNSKPLFYSEGSFVWDKNGNVMNNGVGITALGTTALLNTSATGSSAHGTTVVPVPGNPYQYYIFSVIAVEFYYNTNQPWQYGRLFYSVVDVRLNGGLGDVVPGRKGILLDSCYQEKIVAVTGNSCDYWLIGHHKDSALFKSWHITPSGIELQPVISRVRDTPVITNYYGKIVVSPDRKKLVITNNGSVYNNASQLHHFDATTGVISGWEPLTSPAFGAAFSPNSSMLYLGELQYDLSVSPPASVQLPISGTDIKLGPDGKIYILNILGGGCFRINDPNTAGLNCQVQTSPLAPRFVLGTESLYDFNNEVPYLDYNSGSHKMNICFKEDAVLTVADTTGINYEWADSIEGVKSRVVNTEGLYIARYFTPNSCSWNTDSFIVKRIEQVSLGRDTELCELTPYIIHPSIAGATYEWQDGSIKDQYSATESGIYSVQATKNGCRSYDTVKISMFDVRQDLGADIVQCESEPIDLELKANVPEGASVLWNTRSEEPAIHVNDTGTYRVQVSTSKCYGSDTIRIQTEYCECTAAIPSAFTPNHDGKNDMFRPVIQSKCAVRDFEMSIYNRWGERVFVSNDITNAWDGNYNGAPAPVATYMYTIHFKIGTRNLTRDYAGDLTLIR